MNLILQAIKSLFRKLEAKIPKKLSDLVNDLNIPTPDWHQNDPQGDGYIKNRPFYEEYIDVVWVEEQDFIISETGNATIIRRDGVYQPNPGDPFEIIFDGVSYKGVAYEDGEMCVHTDFTTKDGYEVTIVDGVSIYTSSNLAGEHTIKILYSDNTIHIIDEKYLPPQNVLSVNGQTGSVRLTASDVGAASTSSVNGKMNSSSPSCYGSFSHNRKNSTTIGNHSVAMGFNSTASDTGSFAFGDNAICANTHSFAFGPSAHVSNGHNGYSTAFGNSTLSEHTNQFVCGVSNKPEDCAFIVGIGTTIGGTRRKNGFTVSRNGTGWFAGGLKVGGTGQDDESAVEVALKTDIPSTIVKSVNGIDPDENGNVEITVGIDLDKAEIGQTIIVKAVDENGKPVEWEAVDMPDLNNIEIPEAPTKLSDLENDFWYTKTEEFLTVNLKNDFEPYEVEFEDVEILTIPRSKVNYNFPWMEDSNIQANITIKYKMTSGEEGQQTFFNCVSYFEDYPMLLIEYYSDFECYISSDEDGYIYLEYYPEEEIEDISITIEQVINKKLDIEALPQKIAFITGTEGDTVLTEYPKEIEIPKDGVEVYRPVNKNQVMFDSELRRLILARQPLVCDEFYIQCDNSLPQTIGTRISFTTTDAEIIEKIGSLSMGGGNDIIKAYIQNTAGNTIIRFDVKYNSACYYGISMTSNFYIYGLYISRSSSTKYNFTITRVA